LPFNNSQTLKLLYAINCGLLCLMVGFIAFWVYKKVNLVAGLVMFLSCYFNVWLCYGARNLYWVFWTYLLPMCGVVAVVWLEEKTGKTHNIILAVVTFLTVLLKCACGFEFMSCILVAAELPLLYMAITNKWKISTYIKRSCIVGASGLAGFAGAFGINFLQQVVFLNSFSSAVTSMKYGIAKRTGLFASQFKTFSDMLVPQAIEDSLNVPLKNVMTGYFNSTQLFSYKGEFLPINIKQVFSALVGVFALAMVLSLFLKCFKQNRRKLIGLFTITAVSFLGPIMWLILAKGHCAAHPHVNFLFWSFPSILLVFAFVGSIVGYLLQGLFSIRNFKVKDKEKDKINKENVVE
ncbi:MAG: hypothetical protein RR902_03755, partial [Oscillospiraceae bacterium]